MSEAVESTLGAVERFGIAPIALLAVLAFQFAMLYLAIRTAKFLAPLIKEFWGETRAAVQEDRKLIRETHQNTVEIKKHVVQPR